MKRTGFSRQRPARPPRRLVMADPSFRLPEPVSGDVFAIPKGLKLENEAYRRYVAGFACFECGKAPPSQCAHANAGRGLGQKSLDSQTFPLCATQPFRVGCHDQHDKLIDMTLEQRRAREVNYIARMQAQAMRDGWDMNTLMRKA